MNNTLNINDAWANFQQALGISNSPQSINSMLKEYKTKLYKNKTSAEKAIVDPLDLFFNLQDAHNNMHDIPAQENYKVGKFVKDVYFTMYPEQEGETYPSNWILPVIDHYKLIREHRAKMLKVKLKDAMKGLNMNLVTGCILRCLLIKDNIGIPVPTLIRFMNEAQKRSQEKKSKVPIKLETFERYRVDTKKGIKSSIFKYLPMCYNDVQPEQLIRYVGYSLLRFTRDDVTRAQRIARNSWADGDGDFPDTTSPSDIAIAAMFTVCVCKRLDVDYKIFGLTKARLMGGYRHIVKSENHLVQRDLANVVPSNNISIYMSPMKLKQSKVKKASIK